MGKCGRFFSGRQLSFHAASRTESMLKNLKGPPFTVFGIVRFFKRNNFCLKIRFSQAQHAKSGFRFFKDPCFFYATFKKLVFIEALLNFYKKRKCFASVKDSSTFSALCDLPETFIKKFFKKIQKFFPSIFCFFFKVFR